METHLVHGLHYIWQWFTSVPSSSWEAFGAFLGSGFVAVGLTGLVKKFHVTRKEVDLAKHWVATALACSAFALTCASSVILYGKANPDFLGTMTPAVMGLAYSIYNLGGSQLFKRIKANAQKLQTIADEYEAGNVSAAPESTPETTPDPTQPIL